MLPQPFILQLPLELCEKLIIEGQLSRQDMRSLRLTCTAFAAIAKPTLFYNQVVLSRLREDRDEFEKILKYHGLYVQEIVWHGLDLDSWVKCSRLWERLLREAHSSAVLQRVLRDSKLLWIPICWRGRIFPFRGDNTWENMRQAAADWISEQVESMPNMTTLTIKPMPDNQIFGKIVLGAGIGRGYQDHRFDFTIILSVLLQPWCRVRTLNLNTRFRREDIWDARLHLKDSPAFQHLTTINICSNSKKSEFRHRPDSLLAHLKRAKNLRSLKLCFLKNFGGGGGNCYDFHERFLLTDLFKKPKWPHLHSLHIVNGLSFRVGDPLPVYGCLPRLRHLTLDDCCVGYQWINEFRRQQSYSHLESISIRAGGRSSDMNLLPEARILAFLKNEVADLGVGPETGRLIVTDFKKPLCQLCSA
ncbi:hypothetical protein FHL15_010792 [Xylaria flabelliformis]|uniref:F-box domain-containing protein n=1 Tax=Xylaria flabelliformis TaxID=2512241 RepID=A0A553HK16_9PEZI|nr:hypothetical protein FHL15_010792 [Xylaria flabelliformis]